MTGDIDCTPRTEVIDDLLALRGEGRKWLADEIGKSLPYVTKLLSGERRLTWSLACDMAYALRVRPTSICDVRPRAVA